MTEAMKIEEKKGLVGSPFQHGAYLGMFIGMGDRGELKKNDQ